MLAEDLGLGLAISFKHATQVQRLHLGLKPVLIITP